MKQLLIQLKNLSPVRALAWLERGAEVIHNVPYRIAAWLPKAPGQFRRAAQAARRWLCHTETAQELLAVYRWMERKTDDIHEVPYRLAAWLPTAPGKLHRLWQRLLAWMTKKDITPRLVVLAPLCFAAIIVAFCMQPVVKENITYLKELIEKA